MLQTIAPLFREIWNLPTGKRVIALSVIITLGVPVFLGYYYADVKNDAKALRIEINEKDRKIQQLNDVLVSYTKECEKEKRDIQDFHINKFNEYRDNKEKIEQERLKQAESDYKQALQNINSTRRIINRTARVIDKNNKS